MNILGGRGGQQVPQLLFIYLLLELDKIEMLRTDVGQIIILP